MHVREFEVEYAKLESAWPQSFTNAHRKKAIANFVMDLDQRFWVSLVNRMLVSGNYKLDIEAAARGERLASKRVQETNSMLDMQAEMHSKISESGLDDALKNLGAKSLTDVLR